MKITDIKPTTQNLRGPREENEPAEETAKERAMRLVKVAWETAPGAGPLGALINDRADALARAYDV